MEGYGGQGTRDCAPSSLSNSSCAEMSSSVGLMVVMVVPLRAAPDAPQPGTDDSYCVHNIPNVTDLDCRLLDRL